jgi:hypothetical protein
MAEKARAKPKTTPKAAGKARKPGTTGEGRYWQETRLPLYNLAFVLPMLLFYEIGIVLVNVPIVATHGYPMRNYADGFVRELTWEVFSRIGLGPYVVSGMLVAAVFLAWQVIGRHRWRVTPWMLAAMIAESACIALAYYIVVRVLIDPMITMTIENDEMSFLGSRYFIDSVLACGAGVYEEFVFRVVLIGVFALVVHGLTGSGWKAGIFAGIVMSAFAFSASHYVGTLAKHFTWLSFVGRTGAGLLFGTVYYYRGFGIAAGTHAIFDVLVMVFPAGEGGV